mmetsp:Transcript_18147/g.30074  ORF Transcript_18147/g.30074 Transcript_18147/m.30074 type:complete len:100 (+) Transcript_18147:83-382(+)
MRHSLRKQHRQPHLTITAISPSWILSHAPRLTHRLTNWETTGATIFWSHLDPGDQLGGAKRATSDDMAFLLGDDDDVDASTMYGIIGRASPASSSSSIE